MFQTLNGLMMVLGLAIAASGAVPAEDWSQLQRDPEHSGRSPVSVVPGHQATWVWVDEAHVTHDFVSKKGASISYPNPRTVILAGDVQTIVAEDKIFFGACNGEFYALWLYAHHSGDWSEMKSQWKNLQGVYAELAASPPTYELISGAIAMSRMARALGDEPMQRQFATEAVKLMQAGTSLETFRRNAHLAYSGKPDWFRGSDGVAFALKRILFPYGENYGQDQARHQPH